MHAWNIYLVVTPYRMHSLTTTQTTSIVQEQTPRRYISAFFHRDIRVLVTVGHMFLFASGRSSVISKLTPCHLLSLFLLLYLPISSHFHLLDLLTRALTINSLNMVCLVLSKPRIHTLRLANIRGKLYELLVNCIPPALILKVRKLIEPLLLSKFATNIKPQPNIYRRHRTVLFPAPGVFI